MTPDLRSALWDLKQRGYRTGDDDQVFTLDALGQPAADKPLREAFRAAHEAAGLKAIPMYNARHSFGTALAREGVPARTIQALMRHARLTTTEQYMAYAPQPDLAERMTSALQAANDPVTRLTGETDTPTNIARFFELLEEDIPAKWLSVVQSAFDAAGLAMLGTTAS